MNKNFKSEEFIVKLKALTTNKASEVTYFIRDGKKIGIHANFF